MKKNSLTEVSISIIKFDHNYWQWVNDYIDKHYDEKIIEIAYGDKEEKLNDMDDAYEAICANQDNIKGIIVTATSEDELYKLTLNNHTDRKNKYSIHIYGECSDSDRENDLRFHISDMIYNQKVSDGGMSIGGILLYLPIVLALIITKDLKIVLLFSIILLVCSLVGMFLFPMYYYRSLGYFIFERKSIVFLTTYENIVNFRKKNRTKEIIFAAITITIVAVLFLKYYI